eukprot:g15278.t1
MLLCWFRGYVVVLCWFRGSVVVLVPRLCRCGFRGYVVALAEACKVQKFLSIRAKQEHEEEEVYKVEEVVALSRSWHELCFKCKSCGTKLAVGGFHENNKIDIYCHACYKKNFGGESQAGHEGKADVPALDAEVKEKIAGKYSVENEKIVRTWINSKLPGALEDGDPAQFAEALNDGVVLCKLFNALKPGACKNYKEKASMAFAKMEHRGLPQSTEQRLGIQVLGPLPNRRLVRGQSNVCLCAWQAKNMTAVVDTLLQLRRKTEG